MGDYIHTPGGPVHVVDFGGTGQVFLLVHGLGGSTANWNAIGPRLTQFGHVVAMDLPGFGLSPPRANWRLETHAQAISEIVDAHGGRAALVGNSLGGLLSQMVAASRPEDVDSLILISPATPPRLPDPRINWSMARQLALSATPGVGSLMSRRLMAKLTAEQLIDESLERIAHKKGRVPMDLVEAFVDLARTRQSYPWAVDAVPKTSASIRNLFMRRSRFVEMIREITAPTLVIQGVADPIVSPTSVDWLCSLRPDWTLIHMEDTGHVPQIDAPVRLFAYLEEWLETRSSLADRVPLRGKQSA
jgi:pimeloyl-ACP methyl ester carboxylesterase